MLLTELVVHLSPRTRGALEHGLRADGVLYADFEIVVGAPENSIECDDTSDERVVLAEADTEWRRFGEGVLDLGEPPSGESEAVSAPLRVWGEAAWRHTGSVHRDPR